jgi:outer membrane lipoprotein SlyB
LVGGIAGSAAEHAISDTTGYEYIVRKPDGDLVSVTQKDETPLAIGQQVLVIAAPGTHRS